MLNTFLKIFLKCHACNRSTTSQSFPLCLACEESLLICPERCPECGEITCLQITGPLEKSRCLFPWKKKKSIHFYASLYLALDQSYEVLKKWKYKNGTAFTKKLIHFHNPRIYETIRKMDFKCIVPIPQDHTRIFELKSSPPEILAQEISKILKCPVHHLLIKSSLKNAAQSSLSLFERLHHKQFFEFTEKKALPYKRVLLVDDFYTTGRTLLQASKVLNESLHHVECIGVFTLGYRTRRLIRT